MRAPEFRISYAKIRELHKAHGINLLATIERDKLTDPDFCHSILACVLGEDGAAEYEATHSFEQTMRDIFRPTVALPGEPEFEEPTGGEAPEAETPKSDA